MTFGFASYTAPHPAYGPLRPTVPTLGEVALAPADDPIVAADPVGSEAIAGPAGSWIRPGMPDSPEVSGRITTLTPPPGEHVATIAVLNDTHIGEEKHGLILGDFPEAIVQEPGLPPFSEVMLAAALAEIRDRGVGRVFVNGDTTAEARPHEVRRTDVGGLRVIGLDSSMLDESGGRIEDDQFAALESELATDAAKNVDFVEFGSAAGYPGGYTLGSTAHRNYVVERDLSGLAR